MFDLTDVTVRLGGRNALTIDRLSLGDSQVVGLVGANGAGKTTLLRVLAGLVPPSTGSLQRHCRDVAYVAQDQDQHGWMPLAADEVLRMGRYRHRRLMGRLDRRDRSAIAAAADRLDVADLRSRPFNALSVGQRQRVLIAAALAADAPCLLLDEPAAGLDVDSQRLIAEAIRAERDRGRLVVMSTHDLDAAAACDRVIVLATTMLADGPPDEALRASTPLSTSLTYSRGPAHDSADSWTPVPNAAGHAPR